MFQQTQYLGMKNFHFLRYLGETQWLGNYSKKDFFILYKRVITIENKMDKMVIIALRIKGLLRSRDLKVSVNLGTFNLDLLF